MVPNKLEKSFWIETLYLIGPIRKLPVFMNTTTWAQCYKTFFVCDLQIFVVSWCVSPLQAFPAYSNKYSSLAQKFVNYGQKSSITLAPGVFLNGKHFQLSPIFAGDTGALCGAPLRLSQGILKGEVSLYY
jgi:hypothetical protein